MSIPVVHGKELPIVVVDESKVTVFSSRTIDSRNSVIGSTTKSFSASLPVSPGSFSIYSQYSDVLSELLAATTDRPYSFSAIQTLSIGSSIASFTASGTEKSLSSQAFVGIGDLFSSVGSCTLNADVLALSIGSLPSSLQNSPYTLTYELYITML
jgi:hypothetical protein